MARVIVKVSGGSAKEYDVATLGELRTLLNVSTYTSTINKETETDASFQLQEDDVVIFSLAVKGAV